jgi:hypothetical protein
MKRRISLAVAGAGLALASVWLTLVLTTPVNSGNFVKINEGMTLEEVGGILGEPGFRFDLIGIPMCRWTSPTGYRIWVSLDEEGPHGKVRYKSEQPVSERLKAEWRLLRRQLGL